MIYPFGRSLFFSLTLLLSITTLHAAVDDITGDVGTAQSGSVTLTGGTSGTVFDSTTSAVTMGINFISMPLTSASNGQIMVSGEPVLHAFGAGNQNIFVGSFAGNFNLDSNSAFNTGCGANALNVLTTGTSNTAVGHASLISVTEGSANVAVGDQSGSGLTTGNSNILIGAGAGSAYASSESDNIILGANPGAVSESAIIRIGGGSIQQACYIDGIYGLSVDPSTALNTFIDSTGKLGTVTSSLAVKANIRNIGNDSKPILKFRPVSYFSKTDRLKTKQYGLIAEEVEQLMPELVVKDKHGNAFAVKYHELPVLILNEFQKIVTRVNKLENRIEKLLARIEKLESCSPCA